MTPHPDQAKQIAERLVEKTAANVVAAVDELPVYWDGLATEYKNELTCAVTAAIPLTQLIAVALAAEECKKRSFHQPAGNGRCLACEAMESLDKALQNLRSAGGVL